MYDISGIIPHFTALGQASRDQPQQVTGNNMKMAWWEGSDPGAGC